MHAYNHLLAATDLSARARQALERAARLARQHGARLTLLHVLPPHLAERSAADLISTTGQPPPLPGLETAHAALRAESAAATSILGSSRALETRVVAGKDFVEIIRSARALAADLVVLGAHGENFLRDWVLGTTAERVARKGDRSVLVVKQPAAADYRRVLVAVDYSPPLHDWPWRRPCGWRRQPSSICCTSSNPGHWRSWNARRSMPDGSPPPAMPC